MNEQLNTASDVSDVLSQIKDVGAPVIDGYSTLAFIGGLGHLFFGSIIILVALFFIIRVLKMEKREEEDVFIMFFFVVIFALGLAVLLSGLPNLFAPEAVGIKELIVDVRGK